jgi:hypothetical protein
MRFYQFVDDAPSRFHGPYYHPQRPAEKGALVVESA